MYKVNHVIWMLFILIGFSACSSSDDDPVRMSAYIVQKGEQVTFVGVPLKLQVKVDNATDAVEYQWSVDGKLQSDKDTYRFVARKKGSYVVTLIVRSGKQEVTDQVKVQVNDFPEGLSRVYSMSDLKNWTGKGTNRSVLGIQWVIGTPETLTPINTRFLCWGYRWSENEQPSGEKMILDIAKSDPRLFVAVGSNFKIGDKDSEGHSIRGLGYDANGDKKFAIINKRTNKRYDASDFKNGVIDFEKLGEVGDDYVSVDPEDYWQGGWKKTYCSYYYADMQNDEMSGGFKYSNLMPDLRILLNNSWDVWTFSTINAAQLNVEPIPEFMVAAPEVGKVLLRFDIKPAPPFNMTPP